MHEGGVFAGHYIISIHKLLTNQILLFIFETVTTPLASVCKTNSGAILRLQIKQSLNYEY